MTSLLVWVAYLSVAVAVGYLIWKQLRIRTSGSGALRKNEARPIRSEKSKSGLGIDVLEKGSGPGAKKKNQLTVHYVARLADGTVVDSSESKGRPLIFRLGNREVIDGWEEGLKGMQVGEKRIVNVPAHLAYGNKGSGRIPPGSSVIFEIELIKIDG